MVDARSSAFEEPNDPTESAAPSGKPVCPWRNNFVVATKIIAGAG
jgi:hypothetical protein